MDDKEYALIFGTFANNSGNPKLAHFRYYCKPCGVLWRSDKPGSKCWFCKATQTKPHYGLV